MISFYFILLQRLTDQNFVVINQISELRNITVQENLTSRMMDSINLLTVQLYQQESSRIVSLSHLERIQFEKKI